LWFVALVALAGGIVLRVVGDGEILATLGDVLTGVGSIALVGAIMLAAFTWSQGRGRPRI
jgi:hypothetical protein